MNKKIIVNLVQNASVMPGLTESDIEACQGLLSEGVIDSFGLMDIVKSIEENLDCRVQNEQVSINNFDTIESIQNLCQLLIKNQ